MVDNDFVSPETINEHKKIPEQYTKCEMYIVAGQDKESMPRKNQLLFVDEVSDGKVFVRGIDCFISFGTQENFIKNWETE